MLAALALVAVSTAPARTPMAREPEAKVLVNLLVVIITELSSVNCVYYSHQKKLSKR
jgi:hypothetical protein